MYRNTNRASFLGKPGASCLASAYGKLVAIELLVKDDVGAATTGRLNHNLHALLGELAQKYELPPHTIDKTALVSKAAQLAMRLAQLSCLSKAGARTNVPADNYPYIRYVMHEHDGTDPTDTKEADLLMLSSLADDILGLLQSNYSLSP